MTTNFPLALCPKPDPGCMSLGHTHSSRRTSPLLYSTAGLVAVGKAAARPASGWLHPTAAASAAAVGKAQEICANLQRKKNSQVHKPLSSSLTLSGLVIGHRWPNVVVSIHAGLTDAIP